MAGRGGEALDSPHHGGIRGFRAAHRARDRCRTSLAGPGANRTFPVSRPQLSGAECGRPSACAVAASPQENERRRRETAAYPAGPIERPRRSVSHRVRERTCKELLAPAPYRLAKRKGRLVRVRVFRREPLACFFAPRPGRAAGRRNPPGEGRCGVLGRANDLPRARRELRARRIVQGYDRTAYRRPGEPGRRCRRLALECRDGR